MENTNKDRRVKREIANSNERRRMQSINAGFHKLKSLLPVSDGEKISKANILQHAADFITTIERDRLMLHEQNTLLRQLIKDLKVRSEDQSVLAKVNLDVSPTIPHYQRQRRSSQNRTTRNASRQTKNISGNDSAIGTKTTTTICEEILSQPVGSVAEIISDKVSNQNKNGNVAPGGVAKAVIALPLEVPYTTETTNAQEPRKMLKSEPISMLNTDSQDSAPKGQNLDTICKAIMEIEGDRVFRDENTHGT